MSKINVSQKRTDMLFDALNADPSKMAQYTQMSESSWHKGPNGQDEIDDYSPSDKQRVMALGREEWRRNAKFFYEPLLKLQTTLASHLVPGHEAVKLAVDFAANLANFEGLVRRLENIDKLEGIHGERGAAYALEHPREYLNYYTGRCPRYGPDCIDTTDNTLYPNKHQEDHESTHDWASKKKSSSDIFSAAGLDTNAEPRETMTTHGGPRGIDDPPSIVSEDEAIVEPDPDAEKDPFMKQCVEAEELNIIRDTGTRTVRDENPMTEEDRKDQAEGELLAGICDKSYWGESECRQWQQKQWTVPMDSDTRSHLQEIGHIQNFLCGPMVASRMPCDLTKQEVDKRYDMNQIWDRSVSTLLGQEYSPIKHLLPIEFGKYGPTEPPGVMPKEELWHTSTSYTTLFLPPVTVLPHVSLPWATSISTRIPWRIDVHRPWATSEVTGTTGPTPVKRPWTTTRTLAFPRPGSITTSSTRHDEL